MSIEILSIRNTNNSQMLGDALLKSIEEIMRVKRFDFYSSYTNFKEISGLVAIYDSSVCRASFTFSRQQLPQHDELSIEYARLHAPDDKPFMVWQGKRCRCWHKINDIIRFLDGLSPMEAAQQTKIQKQLPAVIEKFRQSEQGQKLINEYPPEFTLTMHSLLWDLYGQRLFEVFDLRRLDLWEKYREFIKEYYRLIGLKASYGPPYEDIC